MRAAGGRTTAADADADAVTARSADAPGSGEAGLAMERAALGTAGATTGASGACASTRSGASPLLEPGADAEPFSFQMKNPALAESTSPVKSPAAT